MLAKLEALWRENPDLRLGQLLVTATNLSGRKVECPEIFYTEDDTMLSGIQKYEDLLRGKNGNQK